MYLCHPSFILMPFQVCTAQKMSNESKYCKRVLAILSLCEEQAKITKNHNYSSTMIFGGMNIFIFRRCYFWSPLTFIIWAKYLLLC